MQHPFLCAAFAFYLLFFSPALLVAQDSDIKKSIEKAEKLLNQGKGAEAEKALTQLTLKYPENGRIWDKLIKVQLANYDEWKKKDNATPNFTITAKDKDGNVIENDSLATAFASLLRSTKPSGKYFNHLINTCRIACCLAQDAYYASVINRVYKVDPETDTQVSKEAKEQFDLAEKEFMKKNYTSAANYYKKAIELDSSYYKAQLYLGDVYYFTKRYDLAIAEFNKAIAAQPGLLEPRKYLVDALNRSGAFENAYHAAIEAMMVYPDLSMARKLTEAADLAQINCYFRWNKREVFPNRTAEIPVEKNDRPFDASKNSHWVFYKEAMKNVKDNYDKNGITQPGGTDTGKYLEVYSWEYMLDKSKSPELDFARQMREKGFLDCYVFINCFHYDIYDQFKDFVAENREKIYSYFELLKTLHD